MWGQREGFNKFLAAVFLTLAGSLSLYYVAFDRTSEFSSEKVLDELSLIKEDPKFAQFFSEGLASLQNLDSDQDGIPDVDDDDDDNDGIPDSRDPDDDGDGNLDAEDPSTALVGAIDGSAGTNGLDGLTGPNGSNGADGTNGASGSDGTDGISATGEAGADGTSGADGSSGTDGANGVGIIGATGPQGPTGPTGAAGAQGPAGAQGATGPQGATGTVGVVTDDGVIDTTLSGSSLDVQLTLAAGSGLEKTGSGLSLDTSCVSGEVMKWNGSAWACASDDGGITYTAGTGIGISSGVISAVLGTTVEGSEITNSTITADDLNTNSVDADEIATDAVRADEIQAGAVGTSEIANGTVANVDVADDTLNFDKFLDALVVDAATSVTVTDANSLTVARAAEGQFLRFSDGTDMHSYMSGQGTPEGNQTADTGSLYIDTAAGAIYIKGDDGDNDTWSAVDTDTTYTAGTGVGISGGAISASLGTSIAGSEVDADTLNFDVFADALVVDAATTVGVTDTNTFGISRATEGQMLSFADGTDTHGYYSGDGTPEGAITANTGSLYVDTTSAVLYIKGDDGDNDSWATIGGGLSRRGAITADPAPAVVESIYTADASAAAFNITLPAATGTQGRIQIIGGDVETNAATIVVPSGEAMNGVTDGTYTLNTNGQRIEAVDRGTGIWDVVVLGAGSTTNLHYFSTFAPTSDSTVSVVGGLVDLDDPQQDRYDPNNLADFTNNRVVISNPGTYRVRASFYHGSASFEIRKNGVSVAGTRTTPALDRSAEAIVDAVAGDYFDVATTPTLVNNFNFTVQQLPTTETVLAGMVTPESLNVFSVSDTAVNAINGIAGQVFTTTSNDYGTLGNTLDLSAGSVSNNTNFGFNAATGQLTFNEAGRYSVTFNAGLDSGTGENTYAQITDGTSILAEGGHNVAAANNGQTTSVEYIGNFSASDTVDFRAVGTSGNLQLHSYQILVEQLPSSQVVDPGDVPVEDLRDLLFEGPVTSISTASPTLVDTGLGDLATVFADYETLRFEVRQPGSASIGGVEVPVVDILPLLGGNISLYMQQGSKAGYDIWIDRWEQTSPGEIEINANPGGTISTLTFRIYGIKAQKTVINTDDIAVNDQTASGYMDIGDMRIQWGQHVQTGSSFNTITLPAPFANNTYSVTTAARQNNAATLYSTHIGTQNTTDFTALMLHTSTGGTIGAGTGLTTNWQAIGQKP